VVAWLLIQVVTQTFPFVQIPNWAVRLVILALVLGFPVAVILAWAYELTPQGLQRTGEIAPPWARKTQTAREQDDRSLRSRAVLPLVNESANPETDYLSEGISEGIINTLSQLSSLRVLARNTAFRYKNADPQEVGRALKVDAVFAGTLSQRGEQLMIKAELIVIADGTQAWGEPFVLDNAQISTAEELISKQIANKLRMRLTEEERGRVQKQNPQNAEAYRLYLRGRYQWGSAPKPDCARRSNISKRRWKKSPIMPAPGPDWLIAIPFWVAGVTNRLTSLIRERRPRRKEPSSWMIR
jgi:serine/threonine-protein kinase